MSEPSALEAASNVETHRAFKALKDPMNSQLLAVIFTTVVVGLVTWGPVPTEDEQFYALAPYLQWHPHLLAHSFTFGHPSGSHWVFNTVAGLLTLFVHPTAMTWIGRLITWPLVVLGLLRIGDHLRVPRPLSCLGIILWVGMGESIAVQARVFSGFEAKVVAFGLLLLGIDQLLKEKPRWGGALLGASFSFHPAVGFVGGVAAGLGVLFLRWPPRRLMESALTVILFALPGIVSVLAVHGAVGPLANAQWEFLAKVSMPFHFDPGSFPRRDLLTLTLVLASIVIFSLPWLRKPASDKPTVFVIGFLLGLILVFLGGVTAFSVGQYWLLEVIPFRMLPDFALIFFLFLWFRQLTSFTATRFGQASFVLGTIVLLSLPNPVGGLLDEAATRWNGLHVEPHLLSAYGWLRENAPANAVIAAPPSAGALWYSRRAQMVNVGFPVYGRLGEWLKRVETLYGPLPIDKFAQGSYAERRVKIKEAMSRNYSMLGVNAVRKLHDDFGVTYFVTNEIYPLRQVYVDGSFHVYRLDDQQQDSQNPR